MISLIPSKIRFPWSTTAIIALSLISSECWSWAEAPALDHGVFTSPDGRFAFKLLPAQYGYHSKITDRRTGTSIDSALTASDADAPNSQIREIPTPIEFQTAIYRVDWTQDSKAFAVVYHVADGSAVDVFHFDGASWHQATIEPTPVNSKCPYVDSTGQGDGGPVIHYHEPSYTETVFDEKAGQQTVWISYGVETDQSHRNSHFYVCNFDYNSSSQKMNHVNLREVDISTFLRLRARHDYTRSLFPTPP